MDYFTELLESYNKLKKRTFKLEYISEADAKAKPKAKKKETEEETPVLPSSAALGAGQSAAEAAVAKAQPGAPQSVADAKGKAAEGVTIYKNEKGEVVVDGLAGSPLAVVQAVPGVSDAATEGTAPKYFEKLAQRLGGDEEGERDEGAEDAGLEIQQLDAEAVAKFEKDAQERIGGAWRQKEFDKIKEAKWKWKDPVSGEMVDVRIETPGAPSIRRGRPARPPSTNQLATEKAAWEKVDAEYARRKEIGDPVVSITEEQSYLRQMKAIYTFCETSIETASDEVKNAWAEICKQPITYVAGAAGQSLENKLAYGSTFQCLDETGKIDIEGKCEFNAGLVQQAVVANEELLAFLNPPSDFEKDHRCNSIRTRIGLHGKGDSTKLVLFGDVEQSNEVWDPGAMFGENPYAEGGMRESTPVDMVPQEGIVITPNPVQKIALDKLREECPELDWTPEIDPGDKGDEISPLRQVLHVAIGQNDKNAIKGTLYETVPQISVLLRNMRETYDAGGGDANNADFKEAKVKLAAFIKDTIKDINTPTLLEIMKDALTKGEGSVSMQTYIDAVAATEMYEIATDPNKFTTWLIAEAKAMDQWLGNMEGVVGTVHLGLQPRTGSRADNALLFTDPSKADAAVAYSGGMVWERTYDQIVKGATKKTRDKVEQRLKELGVGETDTVYLLRFGQKRMEEAGNTKGGELNTEETRYGYFNQSSKDPTPGFFRRLDGVQFGWTAGEPSVTKDHADFKAMVAYGEGLEATITKTTEGFTKTTVYVDKNGKSKISAPKTLLNMAAKIIKEKVDYAKLRSSRMFTNLFFDRGKDRVYSDPIVQQRCREGMERIVRFRQLEKDLNDPAKRDLAQKYLVRNLLICGYNEFEMPQIKGTNDGKVTGWSQNAPMDAIAEASRKGNLEIGIDGETAIFKVGGKPVMAWNQTGTYSGTKGKSSYTRQTRSTAYFLEPDIDGRNFVEDTRDKKSVKEEGLLVQFLAGQQRLLERLLTPTSMSQLL